MEEFGTAIRAIEHTWVFEICEFSEGEISLQFPMPQVIIVFWKLNIERGKL